MSETRRSVPIRDKILLAARTHFFEHGFEEASMDEIARLAEVAKGSIYRHYPSKGALYMSVLAENGREFFQGAKRFAGDTDDLPTPDRLRKLWSVYLKHWMKHPDAFGIFWAFDNAEILGELPEGLTDNIAENWKRGLEVTQRVLDEGVLRGEILPIDTWKAAQAFWTMANGIIEHDENIRRRKIRARPFHETYNFSIEMLLRGILVNPDDSLLMQSDPGEAPAPVLDETPS